MILQTLPNANWKKKTNTKDNRYVIPGVDKNIDTENSSQRAATNTERDLQRGGK